MGTGRKYTKDAQISSQNSVSRALHTKNTNKMSTVASVQIKTVNEPKGDVTLKILSLIKSVKISQIRYFKGTKRCLTCPASFVVKYQRSTGNQIPGFQSYCTEAVERPDTFWINGEGQYCDLILYPFIKKFNEQLNVFNSASFQPDYNISNTKADP